MYTKLKGCGKWADTNDVIDSLGRDLKLRGDSDPLQNVCGTDFSTFILGEHGIRLCQACESNSACSGESGDAMQAIITPPTASPQKPTEGRTAQPSRGGRDPLWIAFTPTLSDC